MRARVDALLAQTIDCIGKCKTRVAYEFGSKVSVVVTHKEGLVVGMCSLPGNPFDGHTLAQALEQVEQLVDHRPNEVFVYNGYKSAGSHCPLKKIARCSAIGPMIGHLKTDDRLGRNLLKGAVGDALHAVLCRTGYNLRLLLRALGFFCALFLLQLLAYFTDIHKNIEEKWRQLCFKQMSPHPDMS